MRLAFSSYSVPWAVGIPGSEPERPLDADGLLELAHGLGFRCIQYADNLPLHELGSADLDAFDARTRALEVAIQVGTRGIGPWLDDYAALAARFGSPFVRIVVDRGDDHPTPGDVVRRLRPFERTFRDAGLRLAIENHDRFRTAELIGILDALGDWVGICLDTVNSLGCLETPDAVVAALGPRTINLHLKDFEIRRHSHQLGFEVVGTPAGEGMLDVPWLIASLDPALVDTAVLELWTPPAETIERTIEREADWVRRSLLALRDVPGLDAP
jgi:sugar phosphate isomerase/epimerase